VDREKRTRIVAVIALVGMSLVVTEAQLARRGTHVEDFTARPSAIAFAFDANRALFSGRTELSSRSQ
jgi:hypothetical protein